MENMNAIVDQLVADVDIPEDVPVMYEVWAVGYDEEDCITDAELLIGTFSDPDEAVSFARDTSIADVLGLAEDDCYAGFDNGVHTIHVEVETVIASDEDGTMNIGTIYKKIIEFFEELTAFVVLSNDEYAVIEETGYVQIPCNILKEHNKNDLIAVIFEDEDEPFPIEFKIIHKTADYYICEFV
jgi:hypothetical protein